MDFVDCLPALSEPGVALRFRCGGVRRRCRERSDPLAVSAWMRQLSLQPGIGGMVEREGAGHPLAHSCVLAAALLLSNREQSHLL